MGHDTRDITVLFVNGNLTHQKLWSGYFGTKFKIWVALVTITMLCLPSTVIRNNLQQSSPSLAWLTQIWFGSASSTRPKLKTNKMLINAGAPFKDQKTHISSSKCTRFVKQSQQKVLRIADTLKTIAELNLTKEESRCFADTIVRSDYAHALSFTLPACKAGLLCYHWPRPVERWANLLSPSNVCSLFPADKDSRSGSKFIAEAQECEKFRCPECSL